jgi:predicted dehydrogenase
MDRKLRLAIAGTGLIGRAHGMRMLHESDPYARQLDHFCALVRREVPPRVSARDAMRTLAVTLAIAEAAHTGLRIAIPPG